MLDVTPYWLRQTSDKPLFPDLIWSRPEHRSASGKLLVIGGNAFGFAAPGTAYVEATHNGAGEVRVLLPDKLRSTVGTVLAAEYAPSNASGSFSSQALAAFLAESAWADGVLLAGDIGRNSETAILLEKFISHYQGPLTITKDAADYFTSAPQVLLARHNTTLVVSFAQLQKIALGAKFSRVFTFSMDLVRLVEALHEFTAKYPTNIIVKHLQNILVASNGQVSTTQLDAEEEVWRVPTAARASVWWLQNPSKPFEALTTSLIAPQSS